MVSKKYIQSTLLGLGLFTTMAFQNCFQLASQTNQVAETQALSLSSTNGITMTNCQFLGTDTMRSMLSGLGALDTSINTAKGGDLKIVNAQNQSQNMGHIQRSSASLGEADPMNGLPEDNSCRTMKFKIAAELFIDACQAGLSANRDKFMSDTFPRGFNERDLQASHLEPLYQKYIGRSPDPAEVSELRTLASGVSSAVAPAAVCGAILSSLESLVR